MIIVAILFLGAVLLGLVAGVAEAMAGWGEMYERPVRRQAAGGAQIIALPQPKKALRSFTGLSGVSHG
jgi:hypothetical protein